MAIPGVDPHAVLADLDAALADVLEDEQTPEQIEMERRRKIALENQPAIDRMRQIAGLPHA